MTAILVLALGLLVAGLIILAFLVMRRPAPEASLSPLVLELQRQLQALQNTLHDQVLQLSQQMNQQISRNTEFLQQTHQQYTETVGQLEHRLGQLQEATHSMLDIGKDIASLQDILRAPKPRGGFGELMLGELLRQILPEEHYVQQYSFSNGNKVDAVILLGQAMIPVDAKFPLENFKRILEAQGNEELLRESRKLFAADVKKHINTIAAKYILPEEGTFEFALMYIPAENVYYETIIKDELLPESLAAYALKKRVIPVSPNSFYAYLQAIVRGLKGMKIERSARMILECLGQLELDFKKCFADLEKVGTHLTNAVSAYEKASRKFQRMQDKLETLERQEHPPMALQQTAGMTEGKD